MISIVSAALIPALIAAVIVYAKIKKVNVFNAFTDGVKEGMGILVSIFPSVLIMVTAVSMLRASGAIDLLSDMLAPVLDILGIPGETMPLMLIRPFSGSGATAAARDIMAEFGPDSYIGKVASVMMGSSETTFYTIAVYFGAAGIKRTGNTIPAAMITDMCAYIFAALFVRLFLK